MKRLFLPAIICLMMLVAMIVPMSALAADTMDIVLVVDDTVPIYPANVSKSTPASIAVLLQRDNAVAISLTEVADSDR